MEKVSISFPSAPLFFLLLNPATASGGLGFGGFMLWYGSLLFKLLLPVIIGAAASGSFSLKVSRDLGSCTEAGQGAVLRLCPGPFPAVSAVQTPAQTWS